MLIQLQLRPSGKFLGILVKHLTYLEFAAEKLKVLINGPPTSSFTKPLVKHDKTEKPVSLTVQVTDPLDVFAAFKSKQDIQLMHGTTPMQHLAYGLGPRKEKIHK
ncbi:hypothetical protein SK128_020607 [Halocaridina rubra]|uniref:Uncharacterized protein n=1 Tax=Halocaridina rubra TaxID=373956 RepID=A0AAN8WR36_HALRR